MQITQIVIYPKHLRWNTREYLNLFSLGSMRASNARLFQKFSFTELLYCRRRKVDTNLLLTASDTIQNIFYLRHLKDLNWYERIRDYSFVCSLQCIFPSSKDIEEARLQTRKDTKEKLNAGYSSRWGRSIRVWQPIVMETKWFFNFWISTSDLNENFDNECESVILETKCEVSKDVVDSDYFDDNDDSVLSSIATFNDYTSLLEKIV